MNSVRIIRYGAFTLIVLLLSGLTAWYFFINTQQSALQQTATERGFGTEVPSFAGESGSTFENIVAGLGFRQEEPPSTETKTPPRLWRVSATPTAGFGFIAGATSTTLRFMERSTGYLFEVDVHKGEMKRLTNTLVPKIYEATFSGDGAVIASTQSNDGERTAFSAVLGTASSSDSLVPLVETALGKKILQIVPSKTIREFISLVEDGNGSALVRSRWDGSSPERIARSGIRDWRVHSLQDGSIVLAQRAASGIMGHAYRVGKDGGLTTLARAPGLTILPRSSSETLLISSENNSVNMTLSLSAATSSVSLPLKTLADKCVWAPGALPIAYCGVPENIGTPRLLDTWYRGLAHTSDTWWIIDARSATTSLLYAPSGEGKTLDVESPAVDDAGDYIAFMNAHDKSLWLLRIHE